MKLLIKKNLYKLLTGLLLIVLCQGCITAAFVYHKMKQADMLESWTDDDGVVIKDIIYDHEKSLSYDLYLPAEPTLKAQYAMVFIHGGSWNSGDKNDVAYACRRFTKAGYTTVTLNYSLAKENGPPVTFFTMLDDISHCLAHLKQNMNQRNIPLKSIALSGYSAGGHLAMLYAFSYKEKSPLPIAFVFQQVGPTLFSPEAWNNDKDFALTLASAGSGKTITDKDYQTGDYLSVIKTISPALLVDGNTVPGIHAYGAKDSIVLPIHCEALEKALKKNKVPHAMVKYDNSGHFLCDDPEQAQRFRNLVFEYAQKYFR